jgi:hypothetical protein
VTDPTAVLQANRTRRRVRRIIMLASIPVLIALLALCGKLLSMYAFAHASAAAYAAEDYAGTTQAARGQQVVNWFEPYKAPFNVGVGLADGGDLVGARAAFEESLGLATGLEQCVVRVNLALVLERTRDAALRAGDSAAAAEAWQEALVVIEDTPAGCGTPEANETTSEPNRDLGETQDEQQDRLNEKLEDGAGDDQQPDAPETPDASELDDIQDQLEQGAQERDEHAQGDEGAGGVGTARPW